MKLICLACLFVMPMFAALPPFAQAEREIKAILESKQLPEFSPFSDIFEEISKTDDGYLITTNKREVHVIIHYSKTSRVGPAEFTLEFVK